MTLTDADLSRAVWRTSTHSGGGNQCVQVAQVGHVRAIRDSKRPEGGHLAVGVNAFKDFIRRAKDGEYDL